MTTAVASRKNAAGLGKISTTSARRLISLFNRSMGLFDQIFCQCARERGEGQHVGLGLAHHVGYLREAARQRVGNAVPLRGDLGGVGVREDSLDRRRMLGGDRGV